MKRFPHITLFTGALMILSGCVHAQTVQNITPHNSQPIMSVVTDHDPTGACTNYAQIYVNWKSGIQTQCVEGQYVSSSLGGGGAVGPKGDTGATGPAGTAATVTVGTTTTGAAGTNASVTNSGTSSAAVLNFTIPRGADGTGGGTSGAVYPFEATAASNVLKVGTDCGTAPCRTRVGATTYSYNFESDATASAGASDLVFAYIDSVNPTGITFGSANGSVTCSTTGTGNGCWAVSGISNFPPESIPLYRWVLSNGTFAGSADFDARANQYTSILTGSGCVVVTKTATGRTVSLDTTNPSCATGGGGSTFNGGTITAPLSISTDGVTNSPLLKLLISNSTGYNVLALDDDLGNEWQVGVGGSATVSPYASAMYFYDKKNSRAFFAVDPADDHISVTGGFTVSSANTTATALWITNTSTGGHAFNFSSTGSGSGAGMFDIYDNQFRGGGSPFGIDDTGNGIIRIVSGSAFAWTSDATFSLAGTVDTKLLRNAAGEVSVQDGSGNWGTLDAGNLKLGTATAPTCDAGHAGVINLDATKHLQICDGTAYHTITYTN